MFKLDIPTIGKPQNGGLSYVEFHRVARHILDAMDPYFGKGHLYTPEEIERTCQARENLAAELYRLMSSHQKTMHDIEFQVRIELCNARVETIEPELRMPVEAAKEAKATKAAKAANESMPKTKRAYQYKTSISERQMAKQEKEAYRSALDRSVRVPDSILRPVRRSEFDLESLRNTESTEQETVKSDIIN